MAYSSSHCFKLLSTKTMLTTDSPSLVYFFPKCVYILHHNDQVNVAFARSSIAIKTMVEMLYGAPQWEIPQSWFIFCSYCV